MNSNISLAQESLQNLPKATAIAGIVLTISFACDIIYSVYFRLYRHPLARYPGPRIWAITRIPYVINLQRGILVQKTRQLHEIYGPTVRIAPNELSFTSPQAWHDVYGHRQGEPNFSKNPLWFSAGHDGVHSILSAPDADHTRYRRLLSHAFSASAVRAQEDRLSSYISALISRLKDQARASDTNTATVDFIKWFEYTTFDIIGDLALGESFHCLRTCSLHAWLSILFAQFKIAAIFISMRFFPYGETVLKLLIPRSFLRKRAEHTAIANDKIQRRIDQGINADRNDFMTYVQRYNDSRGMTPAEIKANFRTIVVAGSETTATALAGTLHYLLLNPHTHKKLVSEIRTSFTHENEIVASTVEKLEYLSACLDEGLRLCPPVPLGMARVVPPNGAKVEGHWVPGGTFVSVSAYAAHRSTLYWKDAEKFIPERWIEGSEEYGIAQGVSNPFSLGPRACLGKNLAGLEMRLILARVLWELDLEIAGEGKGMVGEWGEQRTWILWEKKPLMVRVTERDM